MKKLLITIIAFFSFIGISYAGSLGFGVSGSIVNVSADGTETTGAGTNGTANTNSKSVDALGMTGSFFLDYEMDSGIVLGFSSVPFSADVSSKTHQRTEIAQGKSGTDATGTVSRKADAEIEFFNTIYIEYPLGSMYAKLGFSQVDVNTKENKITSSGTYGNATLDGYTLGLGVNGSLGEYFTKTSLEYTDFEDLALSSSTNNKITADLDVLDFKIAVGKRF